MTILLRAQEGVCDSRCHQAAPGSPCACICAGDYHAVGSFDSARRELIARMLELDDERLDDADDCARLLARRHRDGELDARHANESTYEQPLPASLISFYRERCEHPGMRLSMLTHAAIEAWARDRAEGAR